MGGYLNLKVNSSACDYNKHYTSCLMGENCTFGWPVHSVFDEVNLLMVILRLNFILSTLIFLSIEGGRMMLIWYFMHINVKSLKEIIY